MININKNLQISSYNLNFHDSVMEKKFKITYNEENILLARFGTILAAILFILYSVLDSFTYPNSYQIIYFIRFTTASLLFLIFVLSFYIDYTKHLQKIAFLQFLVSAIGLISLCSFPSESNYQVIYVASYVLLPVAAYSLLGLNFINATILVVISNTIMGLIILYNHPTIETMFILFLYTAVSFVSAITAYMLERSQRKLFVKIIIENEIREDLKLTKKRLENTNKILEKLSITDELTGLKNRRYFNDIIQQESQRAQRNKTSLGFLMLDIDLFKIYNDTYGHPEGDKVLQKVSEAFKDKAKRSSDFIFRLGGEEFGILVSETNAQECQQLALSLCQGIEELKIEHKNSSVIKHVTVSIGVCINNADEIDIYSLIKKADNALYQAKSNGRNQYFVSKD